MHALAAAPAPTPDWRLAAVLVVLVVLAVAASYFGQLGVQRDHVTAAARAVVQLAVVSLDAAGAPHVYLHDADKRTAKLVDRTAAG